MVVPAPLTSAAPRASSTRPLGVRECTRTCVGCGQSAEQHELVRWFADDTEDAHAAGVTALAADLTGRKRGKGAYTHPRTECLERASRHGFSKTWKRRVEANAAMLAVEVANAAARRIGGLLSGAARAKKVVVGADAVHGLIREAQAAGGEPFALLVLAVDAGAVAHTREVQSAVVAGRWVAFGTREWLGGLFRREEVAIAAVLDENVAAELRRMVRFAGAVRGRSVGAGEV